MKSGLNNNIKLNYLYRDDGNYKTYDSVIFANPQGLTVEEISQQCKKYFIDGEYFYPEKCGLPSLSPYFDDTMWHEFESWKMTEEAATTKVSLSQFLNSLVPTTSSTHYPR